MWCLFLSSWDKEHHKISRAHCIGHKPTLRLHITDNSEHLFGWGAFIRDNIPAFPHNWVHFVRTIFRLQEGNVTWGTIDNLKQINHTSQLFFLNLLCAYFFFMEHRTYLPSESFLVINSLTPEIWMKFYLCDFKTILQNADWGISSEIALRWMLLDLTDDQSTLIQVMAWCRQETSHYLSQCWLSSLLPYSTTRPQWVKMVQGAVFSCPGAWRRQVIGIHNADCKLLSLLCMLFLFEWPPCKRLDMNLTLLMLETEYSSLFGQ